MPARAKTKLNFTASEAVADCLQSLAIESLDPGPRARRLAAAYGRGALSLQDLSTALDDSDEQERAKV